ncbi:D-sedoheptulose-7-phosphate isomerase [Azospirillum rugosum]|uniref:Phosphoheptose isomerase n=1 Tax=Azospirillum rugosum TaxID=416170 RepID=A0ABS4SNX0_9PROT|nr:SIS domain-containing protein [Azospirillum rugosum]MBP2294256.1 D-sedoheptulose 7-phosphate isomerase [Azospirillum rugosum]MDQ0527591.1 D-sedoheptulose 7-phosphate isomerase [Azospirillum rugosum]
MSTLNSYLAESAELFRKTIEQDLSSVTDQAVDVLAKALDRRLPVLVCGNGGSSSDAMHIAGELVGRFLVERRALNVMALSANTSVLTAWSNDYDYNSVFSRQVEAHGQPGGVVWGISTSGNSGNVIAAFEKAKAMSMTTIALTGEGGGRMAALSDVLLAVPSRVTPRIQELHIALYHFICAKVEEAVAGKNL